MTRIDETRRSVCLAGAALLGSALAPAAARAAQQDVFRIGALNSITGSGASYGPGMQKTILRAVSEINAAGGAGGRRLQVYAEDDQTKPEAAVLAAKKLLDVNRVQAILGTFSSGVTLAVMPLTNAAGAILMNTSGAPAITTQNVAGLSWRFEATNDRYGRAFAEAVAQGGFQRPAIMAFNNASGISNTQGFKTAWEARGGKVVASVVYEPNRPSYRSELQQILDAKPDVVVMGSYLPDTTLILREWYQSGQDVKWVMPGWAGNADLVKALGAEVCEGVRVVQTIANEGSPALAHFDEIYKAETGKDGSTSIYAAMCYDMVVTLALAMEAAGPGATTAQVNACIPKVAGGQGKPVDSFEAGREALKQGPVSYQGASSRLNFDASGDASPDFSISMIRGGEIVRQGRVSV